MEETEAEQLGLSKSAPRASGGVTRLSPSAVCTPLMILRNVLTFP